MSVLTLQIPAAHVAAFHRAILSLYAVCADGLHHAVQAHLDSVEGSDELDGRRAELQALDWLVSRFGWDLEDRGEDVAVTGEGRLIYEAAYGVVVEAAEDLELTSRNYVFGEMHWSERSSLGLSAMR